MGCGCAGSTPRVNARDNAEGNVQTTPRQGMPGQKGFTWDGPVRSEPTTPAETEQK